MLVCYIRAIREQERAHKAAQTKQHHTTNTTSPKLSRNSLNIVLQHYCLVLLPSLQSRSTVTALRHNNAATTSSHNLTTPSKRPCNVTQSYYGQCSISVKSY